MGVNTRERDVEGQEANSLGGSVNRTSALKGVCVCVCVCVYVCVCVCSPQSHRKLEDGTVKTTSVSFLIT